LGAITGLFLLARPVAQHALSTLNTESKSAARAPAMLSLAAISSPTSRAASAADAVAPAAPSAGPHAKLQGRKNHGKAAAASAKKPPNRVPHQQHAQH
jgi:hypothetical protein